jgi:hypothetical protein
LLPPVADFVIQRATLIKPFAGGVLEDDNITCEVGNDRPETGVSAPNVNLTQNDDTTANTTLHSVNLEQTSGSRIKLFRLGELPDGLVDRILCSRDSTSKKAMESGVTSRTVRWDPTNEVYIFNGRVGSPIHIANSTNVQLLYDTRFNSVSDSRGFQKPASQVQDVPVEEWDFKPGQTPTIDRFLEGMYETELIDPNTKPEEPEDAIKFLAHSTLPQLPQGRPRVPRVTHTESSGDDSDDSDSGTEDGSKASSDTTNKHDSAHLQSHKPYTTNAHRIFGLPSTSTQEYISNGSATIRGGGEKTPTGSKAFPSANTPLQMSTDLQSGKERSQASSFDSLRKDERSKSTNPTLSSNEDNKSSTHVDNFPTWDRKYAAVDKVGLTGVATNQATWIHENPSPKKKANKSGIALRPASTQSQATTPLLSAISDAAKSVLARPSSNSRLSSGTSSSSYSLASPGLPPQDSARWSPQKWSNKVILPKAGDLKLMDDTAGMATKPSKKPPPGLQEYEKRCVQSSTAPRQVTSTPASTMQSISGTADANLLVDVSENENELEQFNSVISDLRIQGASRLNKPTPPRGTSTHQSFRPSYSQHTNSNPNGLQERESGLKGNGIIERLHATPDDSKLKRYAMNQKAKKRNGRKPSQKPDVTKAVLPKPDPISAVQINKSMKEPPSDIIAQASKKLQALSKSPRPSSPDEPHQPKKTSPPPPMNAIQQLLSRTISGDALAGATVHVRFGMILLQQQQVKQPLQKGAITKEMLQAKLQSSDSSVDANFFPRLTTSISDALFLLDLAPGSPGSAMTQYEIVVKNAEGSLRIIMIDNTDKNSFHVDYPSEPGGVSYIHYPIRIWDAKASVETAKVDNSLDSIAKEFISSMQTTGEAPSFMAMIPSGSFGIEKVYAKRIFSKVLPNGVELIVTEVQDLALESVNDPRYNFKAIVLPGEEMADTQRLWWECELRADAVDGELAVMLQNLTDRIVSEMDGVGYVNKGPWEKTSVEEAQGATEQWFW